MQEASHACNRGSPLDGPRKLSGPRLSTASDLPAIYRATAASRKLASACLGGPATGIVALRNPDGSRTLRTPDGEVYLKFFAPPNALPVPQECRARG